MRKDEEKKTVQVNVWMTPSDFRLLVKSAKKLWPGAELSKSGVVLSLAKSTAEDALSKTRKKK